MNQILALTDKLEIISAYNLTSISGCQYWKGEVNACMLPRKPLARGMMAVSFVDKINAFLEPFRRSKHTTMKCNLTIFGLNPIGKSKWLNTINICSIMAKLV